MESKRLTTFPSWTLLLIIPIPWRKWDQDSSGPLLRSSSPSFLLLVFGGAAGKRLWSAKTKRVGIWAEKVKTRAVFIPWKSWSRLAFSHWTSRGGLTSVSLLILQILQSIPRKKRTVQKDMSCRVERHRWHQDQVYQDLQMKGVHNKSCFRHHLPSKPDLEWNDSQCRTIERDRTQP